MRLVIILINGLLVGWGRDDVSDAMQWVESGHLEIIQTMDYSPLEMRTFFNTQAR